MPGQQNVVCILLLWITVNGADSIYTRGSRGKRKMEKRRENVTNTTENIQTEK